MIQEHIRDHLKILLFPHLSIHYHVPDHQDRIQESLHTLCHNQYCEYITKVFYMNIYNELRGDSYQLNIIRYITIDNSITGNQ